MFSRTEELKNSPLELICVSLAQYSVSSSGHRSCCWGDHGGSCSSLPDTLSASMPRDCMPILSITMLEGICLNVLVVPASLSSLWQTSLSRGSQPTVGRGTALTSSQLPCAVRAPTRFLSWGLSRTSTVSNHLSYPPSSPNLKNLITFGKKQQPLPQKKEKSKAQTQPKLPNKEQEQESFTSVLSGTYLTVVLQMCNFLDFI